MCPSASKNQNISNFFKAKSPQSTKKSVEVFTFGELPQEEEPKALKRLKKVNVSTDLDDTTKKNHRAPSSAQKHLIVEEPNSGQKIEENRPASAFDTPKFGEQDMLDTTPAWALSPLVKDAAKRPYNHPDYDPTTLYVPPEELKKLTPAKQQYWLHKAANFDKILLFKLGKFYELFYEDATTAVKYLDLNYMGRKQHAGFPEVALDKFVKKLVDLGFKTAIVEQTETERQLKERVKKEKSTKNEKIIKRELVAVHTKGTYVNLNHIEDNVGYNYIWSLWFGSKSVTALILAFEANKILYGTINTVNGLDDLKLWLTRLPPTEIIYAGDSISNQEVKLLQCLPSRPILYKRKLEHAVDTIDELIEIFKFEDESLYSTIELAFNTVNMADRQGFLKAITNLFEYLRKLLVLEKISVETDMVPLAKIADAGVLILDAQALRHLEILETQNGGTTGSLYWLLNHCGSNMGKRYLRKCLETPLCDKSAIEARLDAIEDLNNNVELKDRFIQKVKNMRDIEKMAFYLYKYSHIGSQRAVYFGDLNAKRIAELMGYFEVLNQANSCINILKSQRDRFKSKLILDITGVDFDLERHIKDITNLIQWQNGSPGPVTGFDPNYDNSLRAVDAIKQRLDDYLTELKTRFNTTEVSFVQNKYRYEVEMPEKVSRKIGKPQGFEFTSRRQGYDRFIDDYILECIDAIEQEEEYQKDLLNIFNSYLFKKFAEKKPYWTRVSDCIAQIDFLCALSTFSFESYCSLTRPQISDDPEDNYLEMENAKHPILSYYDPEFIGNDISMDKDNCIFVLTGPNMGGKSTIMRTMCINVVLAQLGCYVAAESMKFTLVDRIFTRIGASDKLEEGKSTFYIEMEETLNIVNNATPRSIAIIDELGRGTSTFDGYSIACATLKYIAMKINCKTIFATHYFFIKQDISGLTNVKYKQMAFKLITEDRERIIFLYKLVDGLSEKSFAFNVALLAGIDAKIVNRAKEITANYREKKDI